RSPLLRILQRLVRFADLLEALLGVGFLRYVRMEFAGELAIRALDVLCARVALHTENGVVILVFHPRLRPGISGSIIPSSGADPARCASIAIIGDGATARPNATHDRTLRAFAAARHGRAPRSADADDVHRRRRQSVRVVRIALRPAARRA